MERVQTQKDDGEVTGMMSIRVDSNQAKIRFMSRTRGTADHVPDHPSPLLLLGPFLTPPIRTHTRIY